MATVSSSDPKQETGLLARDADQDNVMSGASFFESIANKTLFASPQKTEEAAKAAAETQASESQSQVSQTLENTADLSDGAKPKATRPVAKRGRPRKKPQTAVDEAASVAPAPEKIEEQAPRTTPESKVFQNARGFWALLKQADNEANESAQGDDRQDSSSRKWSAWSGWDEPESHSDTKDTPSEAVSLWGRTAHKNTQVDEVQKEPSEEEVHNTPSPRPLSVQEKDEQTPHASTRNEESVAEPVFTEDTGLLADLPVSDFSEDDFGPMDAPETYVEGEPSHSADRNFLDETNPNASRDASSMDASIDEADIFPEAAFADETLPEEVLGEGEVEETGEEEAVPSSKRRRRGRRGGKSHRKAQALPESEALSEEPALTDREEPEVRSDARSEAGVRHANKRRMYISILPGEQVEVAITSNGILDEYYLDMLHQKKLKGNIYRGIIVNIDINLQAAFVDFGAEKNGFLQIDEIHPEYYTSSQEFVRGKKYPPIQNVLRLGQEVLVQVVKEPNGSKGAFLTTWISLAGRFLVLTPGQEQIGISRKVNDEGERHRLRELMNGIDPGDDLGVIVRTVSAGVTQATLKNDLAYLKRTWNEVRRHATGVTAPACVYREPGLPERAVRDYLTDDVCEIWVDNADIAGRIRDTVAMLFPQKKDLVRVHNDARHSLWERFNLRRQLDQIYSREVLMPSGGRLVFDQTEALMAIDINSGKISCKGNFENMAFKTNMEAAETIARQLKLRDIGGQVVIDFIEMREHKHVLEVERTLRNAMKNDKARHDVARMSSFGLLELVRQRTGTSAISISMEPCPACGGTGLRRNLEWQSLQALRDIARLLRSRATSPCRYEMTQELGLYVLNHKRDSLKELEKQYGKNIEIIIRP
ncbi:Rne/Rng family ribonuclease [Desulfovibrio sp. An276]|uniref:Rne/Rng family ribonuclease n=1 Tax=Desulfovibrio sp. An276 TaxID=1965618 RepID=UPI001EF59814|nr:Rne/Rng family ribonuclease [Desulfovibrio sp. An276]